MTNDEIKKLIEDAKAATQGEWVWSNHFTVYHVYPVGDEPIADAIYKAENAQHIANTCPKNIVPLLEELLSTREKLKIAEEALEKAGCSFCPDMGEGILKALEKIRGDK